MREGHCDRPFITKGMGGLPTSTSRAAVKAVRGWSCCPPRPERAGGSTGRICADARRRMSIPNASASPLCGLLRVGWPGLAEGTRTMGGRPPDRRECGEAAIGPSRACRGPRLGWWRKPAGGCRVSMEGQGARIGCGIASERCVNKAKLERAYRRSTWRKLDVCGFRELRPDCCRVSCGEKGTASLADPGTPNMNPSRSAETSWPGIRPARCPCPAMYSGSAAGRTPSLILRACQSPPPHTHPSPILRTARSSVLPPVPRLFVIQDG